MIENLPATTPNITDIAQAIAACIGIPLTVITLYKLMRKDKERENEILNLGAIANQLYINQLESEKRYKASKKPHITISTTTETQNNVLCIDFINSNIQTTLVQFEIRKKEALRNLDCSVTSIANSDGKQFFGIRISLSDIPFQDDYFYLNYTTEEGYTFSQDVLIIYNKQKGKYGINASPIVDYENLKIKE